MWYILFKFIEKLFIIIFELMILNIKVLEYIYKVLVKY